MKKPISNPHLNAKILKPVSCRKQQGIVIVFTAVALVLIFGMAGLAVDMGHAFANKTRMKNIIDATALSAARTLRESSSITEAETEGRRTFDLAVGTDANQELADAGMTSANVEFFYEDALTYSWANWQTTSEWVANETTTPEFVTAGYRDVVFPTWFLSVLGALGYQNMDQYQISVVATAAPIPIANCNNFPVMACMQNNDSECGFDRFGNNIDDNDGQCFGYPIFEQVCVKQGSGSDPDCDALLGGHFMLVDLDGMTGGNDIRQVMAGQPYACISGDQIDNKTGNTVGPVEQGTNTRFEWTSVAGLDSSVYPPDHVCCDPNDPSGKTALELPVTGTTSPTFTEVFGATTPTMPGFTATQIQNSGYLQYKYINENAFTTSVDGTRSQVAFHNYYQDPSNKLRDDRRTVVVPVADCETGDPGSSGS